MNRDGYARLKRIVDGALSRPAPARAAYVREACGSDAALLSEVASLLAAAIDAAPLYEDPTLLVAGSTIRGVLDQLDSPSIPLTASTVTPLTEAALEEPFEGTARHAIRRRIGAGGMGIVYEADDRLRGQRVALKTLRRLDGHAIYQLKREFRNLADVAHPNLVVLYDLVIDEHRCFFTMELVDGVTFVEYIRQPAGSSSVAERVRQTLPQLVDGIEELHRRGLQHRDIKPSNVLVTRDGRVVILDFGLTSDWRRDHAAGQDAAGTPAYLPPEQCAAGVVSNAGDWYAAGAMLYHALTGRPPFDGSVRELIRRKTTEDATPVARLAPDLPPEIGDLCMALLHRDPVKRMTGREALYRLRSRDSVDAIGPPASAAVLVGRDSSLEALSAVYTDVRAGRSASVVIHGPSGIGKSALVQSFIERQLRGERVLVLHSRCHEHESIPYKGVDGMIDGLARHLSTLASDERAERLPAGAGALATLFPVLRALGIDTRVDQALDPIALRRNALVALRELLGRLGTRQPLLVHIDDFHWADADSVVWVNELLRPPAPRSLLAVICFRSEELEAKPFLRALIERVDIGARLTLPLGPLSDEEVRRLIGVLLPGDRTPQPAAEAEIIRHSGGNPFLVESLLQHAMSGAQTSVSTTLDQMLTRRLESLPPGSRAFLETLALCGRPVRPARVFEACGLDGDDRPLVARLRAAHLVRTSRSPDLIEMYHDRVRETLAAGVAADAARRLHAVMARVLVSHGDDDPEALFEHYRASGDAERAAAQATMAAAKAAGVLAFDLATTFYRQALSLQPHSRNRPAWIAGLARALENAGRPVEAAEAYLDAAAQASGAAGIECRRKAAELFLIGGQIDRGLGVSSDVLATVGMRLARGPRTAIASLAWRRLQLRWRGLDFTPRDESQIAAADLLRIDACWAISAGLAMVDPIRAAAFNVRQLLRALEIGDPYRIARAMALEAGFSVVGVGAGLRRSAAFSRRAETLAARAGHQYVTALTMVWEGIAAFLTGRWRKASDLCGRSATMFREECTGVTWELNMAYNFFLGGLVSQGELREVARHSSGLLDAARERGNFYLELELNTRMILAWLAADDPDGAERRANEGIARWSQRGFQRQHYSHYLLRVQTELYRGRARSAWQLMERCRRALRRSLFLRVQHTRIESANYRARCALAMAAAGADARRMRAVAVREAGRMTQENRPWAAAFARLVRATVAFQEHDAAAAIAGLTEANEAFTGADMHLYAAVARRRLGMLVGGDEGRTLTRAAEAWMASQDIRNVDSMTRLIAPGFAD